MCFLSKKHVITIILAIILVLYYFCLPQPLFNDPTCIILEARDSTLLGAKIANDGQWRFPHNDSIPTRFKEAILEFEDRRFYSHPGFDFIAIARAVKQNLQNKRIVSGGSTITMQVIRLARKGKKRTIIEKIIEIILATRLELKYSKEKILSFYTSNAPFGGNVVGLEAASWRYFGKSPNLLSWGEASTLAVLPNSPSLTHLGRNRHLLIEKRNRLLKRLFDKKILDQTSLELGILEPLPEKPHSLPNDAPHLLERAVKDIKIKSRYGNSKVLSSLDPSLQLRINHLAQSWNATLKNNEINNLAILILDIEENNVLAYVGNAPTGSKENGENVDIITAARSTGSILKPLLYASMLQEGSILPNSLIPDIPTNINGYIPENFFQTFDGVVTAKEAVSRSLNVPFVRMLQDYGVEKFHHQLKKLGLSNLIYPPGHYGLTLILGGAEANLWDLTNIYAYMAKVLKQHSDNPKTTIPKVFRKAQYLRYSGGTNAIELGNSHVTHCFSPEAVWLTFEAMNELDRPMTEGHWERFQAKQKVAWKTGTSFGFRDAWAIGITPKYAIGVWIGNADGEGRPGLIGNSTAAPLLFDIINILPFSGWFSPPYDLLNKVAICKHSGYLPIEYCERDTIWGIKTSINAKACPYHKGILLDNFKKYQVTTDCQSINKACILPWFVLPPLEEYYYKKINPAYLTLPPFRFDCYDESKIYNSTIQLIYPKRLTKIYLPIELDNRPNKIVFKATHRDNEATIYWHVDNEFIGMTSNFHSLESYPSVGKHRLTLIDQLGNYLEMPFEVITK